MHLVALVDRKDHICCRYRLEAYRPYLEKAGHRLELRLWPRRWWAWFRLGHELRRADGVILQRRLLQAWQLCLVRRAARRLYYDFDDAVFMRDSFARRGPYSATRLRRFRATVRSADEVIAGNAFLAERATQLCGPAKVHIVPTCVDPDPYPQAEHEQAPDANNPAVQLVWLGSASTLRGLQMISPMLEAIGQQLANVHLKLICDRFLDLEHLLVVPCVWTQAGEAAEVAAADIGISWMPDDAWSRGKCGLKVLQYMAAGLPVVANPVGMHTELVQHGETGFLATSTGEWTEAIQQLAHDPALRLRLGQAGRRRVLQDFHPSVGATRWLSLLDPSIGLAAA